MSQKSIPQNSNPFLKPSYSDVARRYPLSVVDSNNRRRPATVPTTEKDSVKRNYYGNCIWILRLMHKFHGEKGYIPDPENWPSFSKFLEFIGKHKYFQVEDESLLAKYVIKIKNAYLEKKLKEKESVTPGTGIKTSEISGVGKESSGSLPEQAFYWCDELWNANVNSIKAVCSGIVAFLDEILEFKSREALRPEVPESKNGRYPRPITRQMVLKAHLKMKLGNELKDVDRVTSLKTQDGKKMCGSSKQILGAPAHRDNDDRNAPQQESGGIVHPSDQDEDDSKTIAREISRFVLYSSYFDLDFDEWKELPFGDSS